MKNDPTSRPKDSELTGKDSPTSRTSTKAPDIPSAEVLAREARDLLRGRCYACHGVEFRTPGLDVLDRDVLVRDRGDGRPPYVVPGHADRSAVWQVGRCPEPPGVLTQRPSLPRTRRPCSAAGSTPVPPSPPRPGESSVPSVPP